MSILALGGSGRESCTGVNGGEVDRQVSRSVEESAHREAHQRGSQPVSVAVGELLNLSADRGRIAALNLSSSAAAVLSVSSISR